VIAVENPEESTYETTIFRNPKRQFFVLRVLQTFARKRSESAIIRNPKRQRGTTRNTMSFVPSLTLFEVAQYFFS